jgi:hypothetical protein
MTNWKTVYYTEHLTLGITPHSTFHNDRRGALEAASETAHPHNWRVSDARVLSTCNRVIVKESEWGWGTVVKDADYPRSDSDWREFVVRDYEEDIIPQSTEYLVSEMRLARTPAAWINDKPLYKPSQVARAIDDLLAGRAQELRVHYLYRVYHGWDDARIAHLRTEEGVYRVVRVPADASPAPLDPPSRDETWGRWWRKDGSNYDSV